MIANPFQYALNQVSTPLGSTLWLYGEPGIVSGDVYHPWKDQQEALTRKGCNVISEIDKIGHDYDAVFVNCPKQREETEGLIALALERSKGFIIAAARSDAGGGRLGGMMEACGLAFEERSKSRFRIVWTQTASQASKAVIAKNLEYLTPKAVAIAEESWWTVPGLFGWNKIDSGSEMLLQHLPSDLSGRVADFGCGYGYLSVMAEQRYPAIVSIDAYDADARAVTCCARNGGAKINAVWQDIRMLAPEHRYDAILMNPPFHNGRQEDMILGQHFIRKAWQCLAPRGRLFMVANRNLPYEKVVPGLSIIFAGGGYKIMTGSAS